MSRPLVIDSFAGGGGASEGIRAALGRDPDFALNHDAVALAMHRINHPDTRHIEEDVWNVDARSLCAGRRVGLLWMSPDCFPAGTLVLTEKGYRPIEMIEVGDRVLTHKQRWRRVTETSRAFRPLVTLRGHGHPGLTMSPEHPVYARRRRDVWRTEPRGYERILEPADWLPASALDRGWYWATPTTFPLERTVPVVGGRGMPFDQRLMWLAGRYLGDGWTRLTADRAELVITCGRHEVEGLREKLSVWERHGDRATAGELAWHERETSTAYQFSTNHRGLVEWLRDEFGHGAANKGLPAWALGLTPLMRSVLLEGYLSADGWRHDDFYEARTVSKALAFSMKALVTSLGSTATVHLLSNSSVIDGRSVSALPIYLLRWRHAPDVKRAQTFRLDDSLEWAPIREQIDVAECAEVFNIGVEEDESYVVEGIVVHNCKHFSKAKGGKPREKAIRGLAWVGVRWIKSLPKWQRPEVVCLENVEEFQDWGPLLDDGKPCPIQRGATFREFVRALQALGYVVEWRELRACDYGAPTIRKRLFLVARRDGKPIVWPAPSHGDPKGECVLSGRLKPWRTAAEIIDWSLPCPSIFETSAEIKAAYGIRANRPLADATMARIAKGTMRYVVNAVRPFLVSVNHGDSRGRREYPLDEPLNTMTASRGEALVTPFVTKFNKGSVGHGIDEPVHTITTAHSDTHPGGYAPMGIVAPFLAPRFQEKPGHEPRVRSVEEPTATITGGDNVPGHLVGACLVPRYGERPPRFACEACGEAFADPHATGVGGLAPAECPRCGEEERITERPGQDPRARAIDEPAPVIVPTGNEGSLAAVSMIRHFGASVGSPADEPVGTITAGGDGKAGVVAAFLAQHNTERGGAVKPGTDVREPVSTITAGGGHQTLVAAHMLNLRGSDRRGGLVDAPAPTVTGGGNHAAAVYAFLAKYYGEGLPSQAADEPLHTITAKPRHGVVTVTVGGQPFVIVDIGMRMLTPRERFNAQGFRPNYVIDRGELEDGSFISLTLEQQGRACGNSVCPDLAEALVRANYSDAENRPARPALPVDMPLFPPVAAE